MENFLATLARKLLGASGCILRQKKSPGCVPKSTCQVLCLLPPRKQRRTMSERGESKRIGAKQHKNSGRNTHKGDATWENFTVDFKEYPKGFTVNQDNWAKAVTDAMKNRNDPAIVVVLGENNIKTRLAIIELSLLEQLIEGNKE
jgi:hypothetical protein